MALSLFLFLAGLILMIWLLLWTRQRTALQRQPEPPPPPPEALPAQVASSEAVLVASSRGRLLFANEPARKLLRLDGDADLEWLASRSQPAGQFLGLFSEPGRAAFQYEDRWLEGSSYQIPAGGELRFVVVLRPLMPQAGDAPSGLLSLADAMSIIDEIGDTVVSSLGVEQVVQALLTIVRKGMPADAGEINLWDEAAHVLVPRGWVGDSLYVLALAEAGGQYSEQDGISGYIARQREPVLVGDRAARDAVQPKLESTYQSFIGVPLVHADRFLGTLEFASFTPGTFDQPELALLLAVSKQVATSIFNAQLYAEQQQRITDLASLQGLAYDPADPRSVDAVYQAMTGRVARLIGAEICGVLLYDGRRQIMQAQTPFHGLPAPIARSYSIPVASGGEIDRILHDDSYWLSNDLAEEALAGRMGLSLLINAAGVYNIALVPLTVGSRAIGLLQLSNKPSHGGFTLRDVQNLKLLASQVVVLVEDIRLAEEERRRESELLGVQELSQAVSAFTHEQEFYTLANERIAKLMNVEMSGILLFDEETQRLVAQPPFYGIDAALIAGYSITVTPGGPIAQMWDEEDTWFTNSALTDKVVLGAGLTELAALTGVNRTMMAALETGGRRIGLIQVSNKRRDQDFTEQDARLLAIYASQIAGLIENTRLYREAQRRAQESEMLRALAEQASAINAPGDSFRPLFALIAGVLECEVVYAALIEPGSGALRLLPENVHGRELTSGVTFDPYAAGFEHMTPVSREPLLSPHVRTDRTLLPAYRDLLGKLGAENAIVVPLLSGEQAYGELGVANRVKGTFTPEQVRTLQAVAVQVGAALERMRMYEATGQNLGRRLLEMDAISRVSNELAQTLDLDYVLDVIRVEALRATDAGGASVALLRPPGEWHDKEPEIDRRLGSDLPAAGLLPIEREALRQGGEPVLINVPLEDAHAMQPPGASSALAVAFTYEDRPIGVLTLFSRRPDHFDARAADFLVTLAAKASVGYANQLRFLESQDRSDRLRRRVEQLNQIFDLGQMLQHNVEPITMMEAIAYSLQQACGYDIVVMTMVQDAPEGPVVRRVAQAGLPLETFEVSRSRTMSYEALEELFNKEDFRVSESFFLPFERLRDWYEDGVEVFSTQAPGQRTLHPRAPDDWRDGDMLLAPITGADGSPLGVISVDRPTDNRRPDRSSVEVLEIFAHQAAATIENTRLYTTSIKGQEQEARLNEVMEAIASTLDINQIVEAVAHGVLRLLPFARMTLALPDLEGEGYDLIRIMVKPDSSLVIGRDRRATLKRTALGAVLEGTGDLLALIDFENPTPHEDLRAWQAEGERTSLFLPLIAGGQRLGVMHIGSNLIEAYGFEEYRPLLQRIANLAAVAVQNARLFNQAVNLQLFNESVFQSIQQGILVLDRQSRIVTANSTMRQRLGWDNEPAGDMLFEAHPSLAGPLRGAVQSVLESAQPRELLDLRLQLQDGQEGSPCNVYMYALQGGGAVRGLVMVVDDVSERAQLEAAVAQRSSQLEALTEVSSRITAALRRDEVVKLALDELDRIIGYDAMTVWAREGDHLVLEAARGFSLPAEPEPAPIDDHEGLRAIVERHWALAADAEDDGSPPDQNRARSWIAAPLVRQGRVTGMVTLARETANAYDAQAQQTLMAFANQMAVALANAELFEEAQARTQRLSLLNRVSVALAQSLDIENILEVALREISGTLGVERATAWLFEREAGTAGAVVEYPRGDFPPSAVMPINEAVVLQHVWRKSAPLIVEDVSLVTDAGIRNELAENGVTAAVLLPMTIGGQSSGAFELAVYDGPRRFDEEKVELALIIANQAAIAVLNANLLEQTLVRTRELETLLEAAQATSVSLDLNEVFQSVVRLTMQALNVDDCAIMMYDNVEETLIVELDMNRMGDESRVLPPGTVFDLFQYAAKTRALRDGHVYTVRRDDLLADKRELEEMQQTGDMQRMLVPLMVHDSAIGMIQVELTDSARTFTHREARMAQALGAQAATAIENARLSTEAASQVEQSLIINDLSRAISSTMDIQQMIGIVREQVPPLTGTSEIYLALYDAQTSDIVFPLAVRNGRDFEIPPRKMTNDEVSFVIRRRSPLMLGGDNPSPDEVRRNLQIINNEGDSTRYLGVPLIAGDQVVGVLAVRDTGETRAFGLNDQRILTTIGAQLGATIQNANLFERIRGFANELNQRVEERTAELQGERDRLDALYRLTSELGRTLDLSRILGVSLEQTSQAVGADEALVFLLDPLNDQLAARALHRAGGDFIIAPVSSGEDDALDPVLAQHPARQIAARLSAAGESTLLAPDLRRAAWWKRPAAEADDWRSALGALLVTGEGTQGALVFLNSQPGAFDEAHLRLVTAAASQVSAAINNADLYTLIRDQADRMAVLLRAEQEEAEKNSAILEGIGDGVLLADARGVIVLFNAAAQDILGVPRDAALEQSLERVSQHYPAAAAWISPIARWSGGKRALSGGGLEIDRVELGERIINLRASPVFNGDQYLGVVSLFRDITRDVEVDRMKSEFISNVSHELRTPMTSIKGYAELLLMGGAGQVSPDQGRFLNTIKYNADRLGHLVDDLLDISRIDSGSEGLRYEPVAVAPLLDEVVSALRARPDWDRKALALTVTVAPGLPALMADRNRVKQILDNIADNAFSYTRAGGEIGIEVALEAQRNGEAPRILFTIRDSGIGIPEDFRDRVWNRFERDDQAALMMDVPGTGLGLSIVKTLVEQHRGAVWFDTAEGKGTTFYVALPVDGPDSVVAEVEQQTVIDQPG
ncbi:MAG: GAF domain-containing protein [Anaerolineae bacterium]|nr:GAF domain-containing protein [Anaerolineae bacterium]